ncbi:MAG: hypothetical protein IAE97_14910 [Chthoniobacterales bacterium]|nr:hypothetical protein [Chthoniobacterales bacterium]
MHRLIVLLIFAGLAYLGYRIWLDLQPPPEPPAVEATPAPTPEPTPETTAEPEPEARIAPEGVLYVVKRFSEPFEEGVRGFAEGAEVRLLRQEEGYYVVTDGVVESRRPRSWFTRDLDLADDLREQRLTNQAELDARLAEERALHEASERERAARWEAALEAVEASRLAARETATRTTATHPGMTPLRIGAWNLEHLGSRNDPPRTDEDMQAIADFIRGLNVQVLGVCEINGAAPLKDIIRRLGPEWKFVLGTSGKLGSEGQIAPGVLWDDSRVEMVSAGELSELRESTSSGTLFHREPVVAAFRDRAGGPDFRMVVVHLKAGRTEDDFKRREGELSALRKFLQELTTDPDEDNDIVVVGDFNHSNTSPESRILEDEAFSHYLTRPNAGRSIIHFDSQIDNIVPLGTFEEIDERSFAVHNKEGLRNPEAWRQRYSDHFPVTVDLEEVPDDDPQAKLGSLGKRLH